MSSQRGPSYNGGPWKPERPTSQCRCICIPRNMGLHILHGHILCILLKSIWGPGTDTSLEKRALRVRRYPHGSSVTACAQHMYDGELFCMCALLVQNWGGPCSLGPGRLCSPHQQAVLLLVTSQTKQRRNRATVSPFPSSTLPRPDKCIPGAICPFPDPSLFCAALLLTRFGIFSNLMLLLGVGLSDCLIAGGPIVCFCLLLFDIPALRMGRSPAQFFACLKTGQNVQGLPVLIHAPRGP